ncbi:hypothetical protein FHL15_010830 [Xylaria flabelliformis]|uniref:Uncharacterized protein n=1 Tax=Xylaria flabelliformis TaxID=2512241 RepID=A0A553HK00_9PEZI|nr:hypothetical protein FHL15_010830 [Xylaria flabelliformis]
MTRNLSNNQFQRSVIVDRTQSSCHVQARLYSVVHGLMTPQGGKEATLIIFEFRFSPLKAGRRVKSAHITASFETDDGNIEVFKIAPHGKWTFQKKIQREEGNAQNFDMEISDIIGRDTISTLTIVGDKIVQGRMHGNYNTAVWTILEDEKTKSGIPSSLRTAVLLQRSSSAIFTGRVQIDAQTSGFSLASRTDPEDDPIIFNPLLSQKGEIDNVSVDNLGDFDDKRLFTYSFLDKMLRNTVEKVLDLSTGSKPKFGRASVKESRSQSWYVELWKLELSDDINWVPQASHQPQVTTEIPQSLTIHHLEKYLLRTGDSVIWPSVSAEELQLEKWTSTCVLIARKSKDHGFTSFEKLTDLLEQPSTQDVVDFFELPEDLAVYRHHDRGTCDFAFSTDDKNTSKKVYVLQTPFYTKGFWSLILHCAMPQGPSGLIHDSFGLIQVDSDVDLDEIFSEIQNLVKLYGQHPMLVPLQLLIQHCSFTAQTFKSIYDGVIQVDGDLFSELKSNKRSASEKTSQLYRRLSKELHEHSMGLAELGRRRTFEKNLGNQLLTALESDGRLWQKAKRYVTMSESRDLDIEGLPDKIESQRAVLYNLITQQDSYLSSKLARQSLRDSKAMKSLAIVTILFLPGAFVATLFSTGMFKFQGNVQEIWIYFVIVVPVTSIIMLAWWMWLFVGSGGIDEENRPGNAPSHTRLFRVREKGE